MERFHGYYPWKLQNSPYYKTVIWSLLNAEIKDNFLNYNFILFDMAHFEIYQKSCVCTSMLKSTSKAKINFLVNLIYSITLNTFLNIVTFVDLIKLYLNHGVWVIIHYRSYPYNVCPTHRVNETFWAFSAGETNEESYWFESASLVSY